MVHWYRKAEEECLRMRTTTRNLKLGITHELDNMKQLITQHMEDNKTQLARFLQKEPMPKQPKDEGREKEKKCKSGKEVGAKVEVKRVR